jgi:hypothetical protein
LERCDLEHHPRSPNTRLRRLAERTRGHLARRLWAAGGQSTFGGRRYRPLIERYDGTSWEIVPSPSPTRLAYLTGVSASSPTDAWAVGSAGPYDGTKSRPLALHWDGTTWQEVSTPSVDSSFAFFQSIEQTSSVDAWAVGAYTRQHRPRLLPLTEHWDGASWSMVPNPSIADGGTLNGVSAVSDTDVWTVGVTDAYPSTAEAIAEHWDGTEWTVVPTGLGPGSGLNAVSVGSSSDVWAVGWSGDFDSPITARFNGTRWRGFEPAPPPQSAADLAAVDAWPGGAMAVGDSWNPQTPARSRTLIEGCCS